jgi:hypothetical protein
MRLSSQKLGFGRNLLCDLAVYAFIQYAINQ